MGTIDLNLVGKQINNEKFCVYLKKTILDQWKCKRDIYPCTSPVLVNRTDFQKIKEYDYITSVYLKEKSVILFVTTDSYNKKLCILCDKLFNFYKIELKCSNVSYYGSLFDCQILRDGDNYSIFINDCVSIFGEPIKNMSFEYRLANIELFVYNHIIEANPKISVLTKPYFRLNKPIPFSKEIIGSMGLVFIPNNLPVISGTQKSNLLWLPNGEHTVDLQVVEDNENNDLILNSYNFKNLFKYATISNEELITKIKELEDYQNGCIVEFNIKNKYLEPLMVKKDKLYPNGLRVIEIILYTITENIELSDFNDFF